MQNAFYNCFKAVIFLEAFPWPEMYLKLLLRWDYHTQRHAFGSTASAGNLLGSLGTRFKKAKTEYMVS